MDKKMDILEREDLRRRPYSVPEGYFDQLQERLNAIPRSAEAAPAAAGSRKRVFPALILSVGMAAALVLGVFLFRGSDTSVPSPSLEVDSYEQYAYADLIPRTEPYIYYEEPAEPDEATEEMIDYLMQYPND